MLLVTDIKQIRQLSREKEGENWGFRSFLRDCKVPAQKIDYVVQKYYRKIADQIDCTQCANCCKETTIFLKEGDIAKLSNSLKKSKKEVIDSYLTQKEEDEQYRFHSSPCPFLEANLCSVYKSRPQSCTVYPNLQRKGVMNRLSTIIKSCEVCPIAYNVFEYLKEEIWSMDDCEDIEEWY